MLLSRRYGRRRAGAATELRRCSCLRCSLDGGCEERRAAVRSGICSMAPLELVGAQSASASNGVAGAGKKKEKERKEKKERKKKKKKRGGGGGAADGSVGGGLVGQKWGGGER
ncbi:hypothetical protein JCGZ_26781 [Jatropha curcas]|uniref:Uncharacterized protein n=1 Tax=Jatropha curcas TaxID=180498 RepID=A0A067L3J2_JATCU|nr:hypothetical protein JCGZ_26781 [Jatropha curcas]